MSLTSSFETELADFTLSIADGGASTNFHITNIGKIKFDFDQLSEENTITSKAVLYSGFDFECYLYDDIGNDLFQRLYTNLNGADAIVTLTAFVLRTHENWSFKFTLKQSGLSLDIDSSKIKLVAVPFVNTTFTVQDVFDSLTPFRLQVDGTPTYEDAFSVGKFIDTCLTGLNSGLSNELVLAQTNDTVNYSEFIYENYTNPVTEIGTGKVCLCLAEFASPVGDNAFKFLGELAISDGSAYGTGFDKNFYISRLEQGTPKEIPFINVIKLKVTPRNPAFSSLSVTVGDINTNFIPTEGLLEYTVISSKTFNMNITAEGLYKGEVLVGSPPTLDALYTGYLTRDIEPILADTGINAIAQSFPANVTQFIEFTLKDCSILKIYESFEFDSSAPSYIVGNVYRISSADYDFLKNEVFIRAYQI